MVKCIQLLCKHARLHNLQVRTWLPRLQIFTLKLSCLLRLGDGDFLLRLSLRLFFDLRLRCGSEVLLFGFVGRVFFLLNYILRDVGLDTLDRCKVKGVGKVQGVAIRLILESLELGNELSAVDALMLGTDSSEFSLTLLDVLNLLKQFLLCLGVVQNVLLQVDLFGFLVPEDLLLRVGRFLITVRLTLLLLWG